MSGRPLGFDPDAVLDQATEVFWRQGYDGTSLTDLLHATGLSKSSLYQQFGGKALLFEQCLARYCDAAVGSLKACSDATPRAVDFLEKLFLDVARTAGSESGEKGCMLVNTLAEFGKGDVPFRRGIERGMEGLVGILTAVVERAKEQGTIEPSSGTREVADYLVSSLIGLRTLVKSGMSPRRARALVRQILRGLS